MSDSPTEPNNAASVKLHNLPNDLIRYHLLHFFNTKSAVKLAQTSKTYFKTLRHKIHRTEFVRIYRFIKQSRPWCKQIGLWSSVVIKNKRCLRRLINHCSNERIFRIHTLLHLINESIEYMGEIVLPVSLQTLTFGFHFNQPLSGLTLPASLHTIEFGYYFNSPLDGITLPANLHTLTFGTFFNQPLNGITLPPNLNTLTFGQYFNQSLNCVTLPSNLHALIFGDEFNQPLTQVVFPASLNTLTLGRCFFQSLLDVQFPQNLMIRKVGPMLFAAKLIPPQLQIIYVSG